MTIPFVALPPGAAKYLNIDAAGSTLIKSGMGSLKSVLVGTGSTSATVTLYDGTDTSGTEIAVINAAEPVSLPYGVQFNTGLYAVVTDAPNVTIIYS